MAGTEATKEAIFIQQVISVLFPQLPTTELWGDNHSALALASNPGFHQRTKHIEIRQRYSDMHECGCYICQICSLSRYVSGWIYQTIIQGMLL